MAFVSGAFIVYIFIIFCLYFGIKKEYRWIVLLTGSYLFYWINSEKLVFVIFAVTVVTFFVGKAEEILPSFYEDSMQESAKEPCPEISEGDIRESAAGEAEICNVEGQSGDMLHPDVIVVDPPRKGCDEKCLETILKMQPERVVYVSCDPATLARDLKYLCEQYYEVREVQPVDMFPQGVHTECVVGIQRKHI